MVGSAGHIGPAERHSDMGKNDSSTLSPDRFAAAFKSASRKLWCLAAAILGGPAYAEDILQDAAITALQRLESFDAGSNFEAWMGQIVRFTALNHSRRHFRAKEFGVDELAKAPGPRPVAELEIDALGRMSPDQEQFDDSVTRALRQLDETPRACFLLRTLMGTSYREISAMLGIPEGTAMSHVHRTRAALRQTLEADVTFEACANWRAS
jgi:RNA polymerase sigma-70 factor, ECF subfamily